MENQLPDGRSIYPTFSEQFSKREKLQTTGGVIKLADVVPEHLIDSVPKIILPGWGATDRSYHGLLRAIYQSGSRGICLSSDRRGESIEGQADYSIANVRKIQGLIGVMSLKGIERADFVGHSEGALIAVLAATLYPQKFRNMVLVAPAGLAGTQSKLELAGRLAAMVNQSTVDALTRAGQMLPFLVNSREVIKYFFPNPKLGYAEFKAVSTSDVVSLLQGLHEKGIGISVVAGRNEPVFSLDKLKRTLNVQPHVVDHLYSAAGGHNALILNESYCRVLVRALADMGKKKDFQDIDQRVAFGV